MLVRASPKSRGEEEVEGESGAKRVEVEESGMGEEVVEVEMIFCSSPRPEEER